MRKHTALVCDGVTHGWMDGWVGDGVGRLGSRFSFFDEEFDLFYGVCKSSHVVFCYKRKLDKYTCPLPYSVVS